MPSERIGELFGALDYELGLCHDPKVPPRSNTTYLASCSSCTCLLAFIT